MGKAGYFESFKQNADGFICSLLPGVSHPQVQYSPGNIIIFYLFLVLLIEFIHNPVFFTHYI